MTTTPRPTEVHEQLMRGITSGDFAGLHELYAEDAVVDMPFAPTPTRFEGRESLRQYFDQSVDRPLTDIQAHDLVIHETSDPEVIVAEWDYTARATTTGRPVRISNVQVLRVRDGLIVSSRDYHDHAAIAAALSGD
jgi:uncharacterized protein